MTASLHPIVPELVLHHFPGACSQVCVFALEHAGLPYALRLETGDQSQPTYTAISPLDKVPALLIDGVVLTENAAILHGMMAAPHLIFLPPKKRKPHEPL